MGENMTLADWIKTYISKWVALPLTLLLIVLSGTQLLDRIFPDGITKILNPTQAPRIAVTAILLILSITFCYILLYREFSKKPNINDYEHILHPGIMKHKQSRKYYCQPCLLKEHITCELSIVNKDELFCHCCKSAYKIDHAILISDHVLSKAWDKAVQEFTKEDK